MNQTISVKRQLQLREYQGLASEFAMANDLAILGLAPNGGKTEISIDVIQRYLNLYPNRRVLVLTHSTTVLRTNYVDRLNALDVSFTYSDTFDPNAQVHVCLPQSLRLIKGKYDFLIVDEAHENYLASRVQRIIKKTEPSKQLLLTGTPSKFIKLGGFKIFVIAVNAMPPEYFAKLNIELVAANYNWATKLNTDYEIKKEYKFTLKHTEDALELIILKLIERVKKKQSPKQFNNPNLIDKALSWAYTYKNLGKTLVVCRSIKQATDVNNILLKHNVNSAVSHSEGDTYSLEVDNFKKGQYDVLVVVDRARLGYSDDYLYNIIDMSGTHNPNIINQMFSRVLRGNPSMEKYYLKVTTQEYGMMDFTHACVCGALMLTDNKYLSTFNGNNFGGMLIPVIKQPRGSGGSSGCGTSGKKPIKKLIFPEFTYDVIDMFKNIIHNLDKPVSIYKTTTIGEVRAILSGKIIWTKDAIFESARGNIC